MHRSHHANRSRGGFFSQAAHAGKEFAHHVDGFVRRYGPQMRNAAMYIAPLLAKSGQPALASAAAVVGQAADSYANLRSQLD